MSTYCIGDIHGCYRELQELLDHIGVSLKNDTLWFVGDLVNRGKDSLAVLRFIKELPHKIVVLGNHDFYLLALYYGVFNPASHTLDDVLNAKDRGDLLDWLRCQPLMHYDADANWVLAHAGIYPLWDVVSAKKYANEVEDILRGPDCQFLLQHMFGNKPDIWAENLREFARWRFIINAFTRMRFCDADGRLEFACQGVIGTQPPGFMPWFDVSKRVAKNERIVFGHWAALAGMVLEPSKNVFALDTGCVWGRALTAMRLDDGVIFRN